jgi:hypothetical protein
MTTMKLWITALLAALLLLATVVAGPVPVHSLVTATHHDFSASAPHYDVSTSAHHGPVTDSGHDGAAVL